MVIGLFGFKGREHRRLSLNGRGVKVTSQEHVGDFVAIVFGHTVCHKVQPDTEVPLKYGPTYLSFIFSPQSRIFKKFIWERKEGLGEEVKKTHQCERETSIGCLPRVLQLAVDPTT